MERMIESMYLSIYRHIDEREKEASRKISMKNQTDEIHHVHEPQLTDI